MPDPRGLTYFVCENVRLRPEIEGQFLELGIGVKRVLENAIIGRGYTVFRNVIGYEGPVYSIILAGTDPGEFNSWEEETKIRLAAQINPFLRQLASSVEEVSEFRAWTRPELSLPGK